MNGVARRLLAAASGLAVVAAAVPAVAADHAGARASTVSGQPGSLIGVTALSPQDVWAVGETDPPHVLGLIEHWDGKAWSIVSSPHPGSQSGLTGVVAVSRSDIWAVGYSQNAKGWTNLIEHWNGTMWSPVSAPGHTGALNRGLLSVSAASADDVWAVGDGLAEHWDGTRWTDAGQPASVNSVAAASGRDVWAVGLRYVTERQVHTLTERWDGSGWTVVASRDPGPRSDVLFGTDGTSGDDIWAVGWAGNYYRGGLGTTVVEHWDGSSWTLANSFSPPGGADLTAVEAISATDAWSVGQQIDSSGTIGKPLVERWQGHRWQGVTAPRPGGSQNSWLSAISFDAKGDGWAVGLAYIKSQATLLVEHWDGSSWTMV